VQTRETYLTILGRARTIGATLEVQDRIQGVQSQIEQLQGQLKVLASQTSYSTLTVDVTPEALVAALPHHRHGLSKAWHTSWTRFGRGIDSLVGAIGPLVLALLILAVVGTALTIGYRGVRKVTS
jgi:VIT1/CCC1 family predicted Fe2+/Mn2+ transporter